MNEDFDIADMLKFPVRDDIPFEVIEQIEKDFKEQAPPGANVRMIFPGNLSEEEQEELREQFREQFRELQEAHPEMAAMFVQMNKAKEKMRRMRDEFRCLLCEKQMPDSPTINADGSIPEGFKLPDGWQWEGCSCPDLTHVRAWCCPECGAEAEKAQSPAGEGI